MPLLVTAGGRAQALLDAAERDPGVLSDLDGSGIVGEFEAAFAAGVDARYAVAVPSGTAALLTALVAAGIGPGDEVLVSTYGWGSTVGAVLAVGAIPVFGDIDSCVCLDPGELPGLVTSRTRGILATHMLGSVADIDGLTEFAQRFSLVLIFDAAQAAGGTFRSVGLGAFGDFTCFSLGRGKLLSVGEGGVVTTQSRGAFERLVLASQHPLRARQQVLDERLRLQIDEVSLSLRIHPVAAAFGLDALSRFTELVEAQRARLALIAERLRWCPWLQPVPDALGRVSARRLIPWTFVGESAGGRTREECLAELRASGIMAFSGPVRTPLHLRSRFREQSDSDAARSGLPCLPVAEHRCASEEVLVESDIADGAWRL